jgi:hypothetical protein
MYLPQKQSFGTGKSYALREDYKGNADLVVPVADPNIVSRATRIAQAGGMRTAAMQVPGYNVPEVEKNFLRALGVEEVDKFYPGADKVPPLPNPKAALEQLKLQGKQMEVQAKVQMFKMQLMEERRKMNAEIAKLEAEALKLMADAQVEHAALRLEMFDKIINAFKIRSDMINERLEALKGEEGDGGGVQKLESGPGNAGLLQAPAQVPAGANGAMV